jgi:hypothetical protein
MNRLKLGVWAICPMGIACATEKHVPPLFESRVPLAPLIEKLRASGGETGLILHPHQAADLARLETGKRYRFVVRQDGRLAIAPLPVEAPSNEYVHPILADGQAVRTAGGLRVDREGQALHRVTVDQDSKAYCPTGASLGSALAELHRLGVPSESLRVENRVPACVDIPF